MKKPYTIPEILKTHKRVAVLGLKPGHMEVSNQIFHFLIDKGFDVVGVNPKFAGTYIAHKPVYGTLSEIPGQIDIVDVFRASEHLHLHVEDILKMNPLPGVVWFQQGISSEEVGAILEAKGIQVIQDYCIAVAYATHRMEIEG